MSRLSDTIARLRAIDAEVGRGDFDAAMRVINRERLQSKRTQQRERFKWSEYERLYEVQGGICPWCEQPIILLKRQKRLVEIDHINPNLQDFNAKSNLQLLHHDCNRTKAAMTMEEQSKRLGKPVTTILNGGRIDGV